MSDQWYTPSEFIESARRVLGGIDLDPASCEFAQQTVRAERYYTKEDDGLAQPWGGRVYLNPPYSQPLPFIEKLINSPNVTAAIVLKKCSASPKWAQKLLAWSDRVCFVSKRIAFVDATGMQRKNSDFDNAFFYGGPRPDLFTKEFSVYGIVMQLAPPEHACLVCQLPIVATRRDARFCSSTCRSQHHRRKANA
jgi:ParB family chromosome partitioning protein